MSVIDRLIDKKYGTFNDLVQLTLQEMTDIIKVLESKKQEQQLYEAGLG
jgi:hypothetical protein